MEPQNPTCAILADRHIALAEGVRDLLESAFETVYVVADAPSLREGVHRLTPALIVLDLSLVGSECLGLLKQIRDLSPQSRLIVLSVHDQATVARLALGSGAHGVVLKRTIGRDFLSAIGAVLGGEVYVSHGFGLPGCASDVTAAESTERYPGL
jgi:two-component system response regulator NreC